MEFSALMVVAIGAAIFVGAVLQRLSGSGMGLVLAPMLTLMGSTLARRVSVDAAKRLAMIVAGVGAASALARGLIALA